MCDCCPENNVIINIGGGGTPKTFVMDHPMDNERYLVHACLEGPEAGVYYRGKSEIIDETEIILPEYTLVFREFTVHITPIGQFAKLYASEVKNGKFTVYNSSKKKKQVAFHWVVYARRQSICVEPPKSITKVHGEGPYRWI